MPKQFIKLGRKGWFVLRRGSGGAGEWHGGDGIVRSYRFLEPLTVSLLTEHRTQPPFGMNGGEPGQTGRQVLVRDGKEEALAGTAQLSVRPGDLLRMETPGGGGWGHVRQT